MCSNKNKIDANLEENDENKVFLNSSENQLKFTFGHPSDKQPPASLRRVLQLEGWTEVAVEQSWNLYWSSGRFLVGEYGKKRQHGQRINHFAKSSAVCCKDSLARVMRRCRLSYGKMYDFVPETYILPNEYNKFIRAYSETRDKEALWICKPSDSSRGNKIFVFKDLKELVYDCSTVIQRYVSDPMLIGNYKFDVRLYVLVRSCHPLDILVFKNGLVRFGTMPYNNDTYNETFAHLTNYSINKFSPTYNDAKEVIGKNNKWTLNSLFEYLRRDNIDVEKIWMKIKALVVLTLATLPNIVPKNNSNTCFELFGFDILLDAQAKPWLLEINTSPALSIDSYEDEEVKISLLRDMLQTFNFSKMPSGKAAGKHKSLLNHQSKTSHYSLQKEKVPFQAAEIGQFEQVFPFDQESYELSQKLCNAKDCTESTQTMKNIVKAVRQWMKASYQEQRMKASVLSSRNM